MIASAMTASWSVPFLVLAVVSKALGYAAAASFAWSVAFWILAMSCVAAVATLVLSSVGQRAPGDAVVPPAAPDLSAPAESWAPR